MKTPQVHINTDLSVAIGDQTARLSPGEAFRLAERLIRGATRAIVQDEADHALVNGMVRDAGHGRS